MLHKIKTSILQLTTLTLLIAAGLSGAAVAQGSPPNKSDPGADPQQALCKGARDLKLSKYEGKAEQCKDAGGDVEKSLNDLITQIINIFSIIVGIIAVIMIILGGLKYITSGGDSGRITSAKNTLIYALIGLVIVALAQFVVRFVLAKASEATP